MRLIGRVRRGVRSGHGKLERMPLPSSPRSPEQRKVDVLAKLTEVHADVWVATAGVRADGEARAHLVPLSLAWVDDRVVVAVESTSVTARNVAATGAARLALGHTRDVVMVDAALDRTVSVQDAGSLGTAYAAQADWDPRTATGEYVFLVLRPVRIQAWREADEIAGRTVMRAGEWLV